MTSPYSIPQILKDIYGISDKQDMVELLLATLHTNARSILRGASAELQFSRYMLNCRNIKADKVPDNDKSCRYDFTYKSHSKYNIEIKLADKHGTVNISFRDSRDIKLPSGKVLQGNYRHRVRDSFDILGVHLNENWGQFVWVPSDAIPGASVGTMVKRKNSLHQEDIDFLHQNYYSSVVTYQKMKYFTDLNEAECYIKSTKINPIKSTSETPLT